ncbi:MAG: hypothetical protein COU08_01045 [Candidatus Harrisonbacteria bacterium CG10_big_fil_rev_8_21_14_0_10_42_17]|uniref:5'-3' exonuclease domain-containing protein n=1 Tax=Candidatus Harrisonbacteria bacterium CG10_big_fil_rev_8_21_14_0_10_42_17 TaxID=1974584 RepID=A0A2M6WIZ4_9BACT|nr:MAG: hypothetical protein COU08_01045 [Candidatus Harrisonbacteria bacterium CG10_big_fil_rev_8_21_14_0_10_42_17]
MKRLLLIDAHALIHRFYHALPPLTTPQGDAIQAIYGVCSVLLKIKREQNPDFVAAALDRPEPTFRKQQFNDYKAHRAPTASDLIDQIKQLPEVFSLFGVSTYSQAGFEADDVIGTLVHHFKKDNNLLITILSGDLDLLQLVENDTVVVEIIKGGVSNIQIYNETAVLERYGIASKQLSDYKGLVGDVSDNIPGVRGVGKTIATKLIQDFRTIEGVYENLPLIEPKISKKLSEGERDAIMSKQLATIHLNAPLVFPKLEALQWNDFDINLLTTYFTRHGFSSLLNRLRM